jgi:hypothetical protein
MSNGVYAASQSAYDCQSPRRKVARPAICVP